MSTWNVICKGSLAKTYLKDNNSCLETYSNLARTMLPVTPFYIKSWLVREYVSICANKTKTFWGGNTIYLTLLLNFLFFLVVTTPIAYLQDIAEDDARLGGHSYGTWVFFGVVAILMVTFAVCAVRKLTKVRTQIFINHSFKQKEK